MNLVEYPDREMMMIDVANVMAGELNSCLMRHNGASLAVPGGSTPGPMFDNLCDVRLDWSRIHVTLTDERWVPQDHERSNARLVHERLLQERAAAAHFVPLYAHAERPEEVIEGLIGKIEPLLPISVLLLGMGDDMHTASLFPGAEGLREALDPRAPPLAAIRPADEPETRITLTAPVLRGAMATHILIAGAEKREALERARRMSPEDAPVAVVLGDATVHWSE